MRTIRIIAAAAAATTAALLFAGCGGSNDANSANAPTGQSQQPEAPGTADSTGALYANGWTEVIINANFAKTTVDHVAHFATTRNACGRDAYGVLELALWNTFTEAMNEVVKDQPLEEPRCRTVEEYSKMDGTAEGKFDTGKRLLFEVRGYNEICTTIRDSALAAKLLDSITAIVLIADKEECSLVQ